MDIVSSRIMIVIEKLVKGWNGRLLCMIGSMEW